MRCWQVLMLLLFAPWMAAQHLAAAPRPPGGMNKKSHVSLVKITESTSGSKGHYIAQPDRSPDSSSISILVLYENGGHHLAFSKAAIPWLNRLAAEEHYKIIYLQNTDTITTEFLAGFRLFIQLDYPPYTWPAPAMLAFRTAIEKGTIGWLGLHHATLLGEFDGYPMWNWFSWFMGGIRFKNYIAGFASAEVTLKDRLHPVTKGIPGRFFVPKEEWYTWDKPPDSSYIHVLAQVDESSYRPGSEIKMHGRHPVIWTNTQVKARNLYIFMGHDPGLWADTVYQKLFKNAVLWTAARKGNGLK